MARSVSQQVKNDRGPAGCFAAIAALPALAVLGAILWLLVRSLSYHEKPEDLILSGVFVLFALMFWLVAGWSYSAARAAMTPQRVQAMWLRRFQAEKGSAFRPSRVIDKLSRHGISAITLQDRDVKLSFEQRRNRLAPTFWFFFAPIGALLAYAGFTQYQKVQYEIAHQQINYSDNIGEAIGQAIGQGLANSIAIVFVILLFAVALMLTSVLIFLVAAISGPFGAMFGGKRDDFGKLPQLLERLQRGKGRRGASIVRISDAHWREAVSSTLQAVDVAIIDLTNVSEHVAWEIGEAVKGVTPAGIVFICSEHAGVSDAARHAVGQSLGRDPGNVVLYPESGDGKHFAKALHEQIYAAADRRDGAKR